VFKGCSLWGSGRKKVTQIHRQKSPCESHGGFMSWIEIERRSDGSAWANKSLGLIVIESVNKEQDGKLWKHVSLSRRSRLPSYEDMKLVKDKFIGEDKLAIQIFVPKSEHVNIHEYCLHLWCCLDENVLPDFTNGSGMI